MNRDEQNTLNYYQVLKTTFIATLQKISNFVK